MRIYSSSTIHVKGTFENELPNEYSSLRHKMTFSRWRRDCVVEHRKSRYKHFGIACLQAFYEMWLTLNEISDIFPYVRVSFILVHFAVASNGLFFSDRNDEVRQGYAVIVGHFLTLNAANDTKLRSYVV